MAAHILRDATRSDGCRFSPADYERYDALGLAELVAAKQVTPEELLDAALERTDARNPALNAVVFRWDDEARRALRAGLPAGPFQGVPYLLKDLGTLYAGQPMSSGSGLFAEFVADHDSELVARWRAAGLVAFGRDGLAGARAHEHDGVAAARGDAQSVGPGRARPGVRRAGRRRRSRRGSCPWPARATAGGRSGFRRRGCGLFGLKPTRGRTPSGPDVGEGWAGMSTAHVVSRSVRDSAAALDATSGPDLGAPYWAQPPERPFLDEVGADPGRLRDRAADRRVQRGGGAPGLRRRGGGCGSAVRGAGTRGGARSRCL